MEDEGIVGEFVSEAREALDLLDRRLVDLERTPDDPDALGAIFRAVHSIKGASGFLGFQKLEALTHAGETLLARARDGSLALDTPRVTALLAMIDGVRSLLDQIEAHGEEGDAAHDALVEHLLEQAGGASDAGTAPASVEPAAPVGDAAPSPDAGRAADAAERSLRVSLGLLEELMNGVGELVLVRNQLLQHRARIGDRSLLEPLQRLDHITSTLQANVIKTRTQPFSTVWNKFPRLVRDLALACGKKARLEMQGGETELDKTILETIKDPLMHLVRNAIDHGIEPPAQRLRAGKPEEGSLLLRAHHQNGQVHLEVRDDGAGVDIARVKARGLELGLLSAEHAANASADDLVNLIFAPGFSTTEKVTNLSGRGVGLDVVKNNIARLGGHIEVKSAAGQGTCFSITLPLTLAIIPALIVRAGNESYAIPQASLVELVRADSDESGAHAIEHIHDAPVHRLRGRLLPLVDLLDVLGAGGTRARDAAESRTIVVLQVGDRQFGLIVDDVRDGIEVVVKPLGPQLRDISLFSGVTILGDGSLALILDVVGLAKRGRVLAELRDRPAAQGPKTAPREEGTALLLLRGQDDSRMAVPLAAVARIEEVETERIEHVGDRDVLQYHGEILPLARIEEIAGLRRGSRTGAGDSERVCVVVCECGAQRLGLVVDGILDTVETPIRLDRTCARDGLLATQVIHGRVTQLLDAERIRVTMAQLAPGANA